MKAIKTPVLLAACGGIGVVLAFAMITTHTGPGIKPLPLASNPQNRNEIRKIEINQIGDALTKYFYDHGKFPVKLSAQDVGICTSFGANCSSVKLLDLNFLVADGSYLNSMSSDPAGSHVQWDTGYTVALLPDNQLRLSAPQAESGAKISVVKKLELEPGPARESATN